MAELKEEIRDCKISIKVTKTERAKINIRAKELNQNRTDYMRSLILEDACCHDINYSRTRKPEEYVKLINAINNISVEEERKEVSKCLEGFVCL